MSRETKIDLLSKLFNEGNTDSLETLSRLSYPVALIFTRHGKNMLFDARLNPDLPARFTDRVMNDLEVDAMVAESGNPNTFFLPDNGRN